MAGWGKKGDARAGDGDSGGAAAAAAGSDGDGRRSNVSTVFPKKDKRERER